MGKHEVYVITYVLTSRYWYLLDFHKYCNIHTYLWFVRTVNTINGTDFSVQWSRPSLATWLRLKLLSKVSSLSRWRKSKTRSGSGSICRYVFTSRNRFLRRCLQKKETVTVEKTFVNKRKLPPALKVIINSSF